MAQEARNLSPTIPLQDLLREAEHDPFKMLVASPIKEVREACLEALRRNPYRWVDWNYRVPDQIEKIIRAFKEADDHLWEELFNWYVHFAGEGKDFSTAQGALAVEFAIAFCEEDPSVLHEAAKAIGDKLRQRPQLYWEVMRMPASLESLLSAVRREKDYSAGAWRLTERAIRRIVVAEDVTFLGHVVELLRHHREGIIQPDYQYEDPFARVQNEALLAEAIRRLTAAKNEQTPDLSATVGTTLRQKAGLEDSVVVEVEYPTSSVSAGDRPVAVRISLRAARDSEQDKLLAALGKVTVTLGSDGSLEVKRQEEQSYCGEWLRIGGQWDSGISRRFADKPSCEFLIRSRPGRRRLWLSFRDGETDLAERAVYLTFE